MTKKDRTGVFVTFDDRVEDLHAPTEGELEDLFRDLLRWREVQPEAMPPELWDRFGKLVLWQMCHLSGLRSERTECAGDMSARDSLAALDGTRHSSTLPTCSDVLRLRLVRT